MEIYTIKRGIMKQIPEDHDLKQAVKFILVFALGLMLGNYWARMQF